MRKLLIPFLVFSTLYLLACTTDSNGQPPLNPNGDSELALLMRAMYDDGLAVKEQLQKGIKTRMAVEAEKIRTAQATDPGRMKTPAFATFADAYVEAVSAYQSADPAVAKDIYNGVVNACMNCHRNVCPGPTVKIKKLFL